MSTIRDEVQAILGEEHPYEGISGGAEYLHTIGYGPLDETAGTSQGAGGGMSDRCICKGCPACRPRFKPKAEECGQAGLTGERRMLSLCSWCLREMRKP